MESAPMESAPRDIAPRDIAPRDIAPRDVGPRDVGPRDVGLGRSVLKGLRLGVPALLLLIVMEAGVSVAAGWPHQFNGSGDPHRVLAELPIQGTALAPPAFLIVLLGLVAIGVWSGGRWRTAAIATLLPLGVVMIVGATGEAFAPATPDVPRGVQLLGGGGNALLSAALLITAVLALLGNRGRRQVKLGAQ